MSNWLDDYAKKRVGEKMNPEFTLDPTQIWTETEEMPCHYNPSHYLKKMEVNRVGVKFYKTEHELYCIIDHKCRDPVVFQNYYDDATFKMKIVSKEQELLFSDKTMAAISCGCRAVDSIDSKWKNSADNETDRAEGRFGRCVSVLSENCEEWNRLSHYLTFLEYSIGGELRRHRSSISLPFDSVVSFPSEKTMAYVLIVPFRNKITVRASACHAITLLCENNDGVSVFMSTNYAELNSVYTKSDGSKRKRICNYSAVDYDDYDDYDDSEAEHRVESSGEVYFYITIIYTFMKKGTGVELANLDYFRKKKRYSDSNRYIGALKQTNALYSQLIKSEKNNESKVPE